jgi:phage baseplate assembly protein W
MSIPVPNLISWPLGGVASDGRWRYAEGEGSVREVLLNILLTRPGERLMRPELGAGLPDFLHRPNDQTTRHQMAEVVRKSIRQWEPRVVVEAVEVQPDPVVLSEVHLTVRYRMRHGVAPMELSLALALEQPA